MKARLTVLVVLAAAAALTSAAAAGSTAAKQRMALTVTVLPSGRVLAAWLDHREMAAPAAAAPSGAHAGHGSMPAEPSKLYVAALDGQPAGRAVASGVCYCCKTAMAAGPDMRNSLRSCRL